MKILYLAHRIPYPPNKGDKIRSFNEIRHLCRSNQIDLICLADNPDDVHYQNDLKKYCGRVFVLPLEKPRGILKGLLYLLAGRPISVGYFYRLRIQQTTDQWLSAGDYDAIVCFSSPMAEYVFRSKKHRSGRAPLEPQTLNFIPRSTFRRPRLIMDFCDVDSDKWAQYAESSRFPRSFIYRRENRSLAAYEKRIAENFDHSIFVSEKEAEIFRRQNPHVSNVSVIPNGVDYEYFSPDQPINSVSPNPCPMLLFTGAMDYHANVDGVTWFSEKILPPIKASIDDAKFYIVGSNPTREVKSLDNGHGIKVTGFVDDIRPYFQKADVCVIPLRLARGVQNKVLEAMAMGNAVVTTSKSIQGITAVNGKHLIVADDPEDFARAVSDLLGDRSYRISLGKEARAFVLANYDWNVNMGELERILCEAPEAAKPNKPRMA
jgi:sugar transferase (PEP-CTERM/EpsH1 system associated)